MSVIPHPLDQFPFARDISAGSERALHRVGLVADATLKAGVFNPWTPWNATEIDEVRTFNQLSGNAAGTHLAEVFGRDDVLAIVTGQQPNLLASPLYILHKALSACAHAERLSSQIGRIVVPVFWIASDDHDFNELRDCWMISDSGRLVNLGRSVSRGHGVPAGSPAYLWNLSDSADRLLGSLSQLFATSIPEYVRTTISEVASFEMAFAKILAALVGPDKPMLFVAPRLSVFRRRQTEILLHDIKLHEDIAEAITQSGAELQSDGYDQGIKRPPGLLNSFFLRDQKRLRLQVRNAKIEMQDTVSHQVIDTVNRSAIEQLLVTSPERFSPNVVTRPMVQDVSLPTAAYIAGPGEILYLAQLRKVYPLYGLQAPPVILRTSVTVYNQKMLAWLDRRIPESMDSDLPAQFDAVIRQKTDLPSSVLQEILSLELQIESGISALRSATESMHPHVQTALYKTSTSMHRSLDKLRDRLARQHKSGDIPTDLVLSLLAPKGKAQERMLSPLNFNGPEPDSLARQLWAQCNYSKMHVQAAELIH